MKAIFFDTNVFYDVKFDVDTPELAQVIALAKRLSIVLWISPITVREISVGIDRKIDALLDAYRNVSSILENTSDDTV
ncbi:hypothetical protein FAP94_18325, partial [Morganella morganii]|nr:hypothetical protein [Morganella morganii]